MKTGLYDKLKERADKEGIDLSVLIRTFLWEGLKKDHQEIKSKKIPN